jgi:hypothetical protein
MMWLLAASVKKRWVLSASATVNGAREWSPASSMGSRKPAASFGAVTAASASFGAVTAAATILPLSTALEAIFGDVTAALASFAIATAPSAILSLVTAAAARLAVPVEQLEDGRSQLAICNAPDRRQVEGRVRSAASLVQVRERPQEP